MEFVLGTLIVLAFAATGPFWLAFARATRRIEPNDLRVRPRGVPYASRERSTLGVPVTVGANGLAPMPAVRDDAPSFTDAEPTAPYGQTAQFRPAPAPASADAPADAPADAAVGTPEWREWPPAASAASVRTDAAAVDDDPMTDPALVTPQSAAAAAATAADSATGSATGIETSAAPVADDAARGVGAADLEASGLYDQDATAERVPLYPAVYAEDPSLYDQDATAERRR